MTETPDPLLAIDRALTDEERTTFDAYVKNNWPRLVGAHVADVLEHTTSYDMFLDQTEPWFESYGAEFADGLPLTAVLHTLIILGRELTVVNVTKILLRAGLMPKRERRLTWRHLAPDNGDWLAQGADGTSYLVTAAPGGIYLTRWPGGGYTHLFDVRQAVHHAAPVTTEDEGRRMAELFESGEDIPGIGWFHGTPPSGVSTT